MLWPRVPWITDLPVEYHNLEFDHCYHLTADCVSHLQSDWEIVKIFSTHKVICSPLYCDSCGLTSDSVIDLSLWAIITEHFLTAAVSGQLIVVETSSV